MSSLMWYIISCFSRCCIGIRGEISLLLKQNYGNVIIAEEAYEIRGELLSGSFHIGLHTHHHKRIHEDE